MKRLFDFLTSLIALILLSPVLLVVALLIRRKLGSPVLFRQVRPGLNGEPFEMVKFRSMVDAYDEKGHQLPNEQRLTRFGKVLRSTSLDELPGLWNVLKGDMSLVGPRPLLMEYLPLYSGHQARRHEIRPGITGWAQVNGRNSISWEEKFDYDVWYVDNQSFLLDVKILLLTVKKVFVREGISSSETVTMPKFQGNNDAELVVIGASGWGKEIVWLAKRAGWDIKGFLDDDLKLVGETFYHFPILGSVSDWLSYANCNFVVAIASPLIRKKVVEKMCLVGTPRFSTLIDPGASIEVELTSIGQGVVICAGSVVTADVKIEDHVIVNKLCSVGHDVKLERFSTLAPKVMIGGKVSIKKGAEIGASSAIRQGLVVGAGAMVGMGAVVTKDVPAGVTVVGNPARLFEPGKK